MADSGRAFSSYDRSHTQLKGPDENPSLHAVRRDTEPDNDSEKQKKQNLVYEERARTLAKQSKFFEAVSCFEQIEQEGDDIHQLGLNLLKAECYIQLGRETKAAKSIKAVERALLTGPEVDVDLLISLGESMGSDESFLRSVILLKIASDIYKNSRLDPMEIVDGIARCIQISKDILATVTKQKSNAGLMDLLKINESNAGDLLQKALKGGDSTRNRVIVLDFGVEYMKEMLADLRGVRVGDADIEKKVIKEAWSATHVGFVLANVEEFDKSYRIRKQGVDAMENILGDRAVHHRVYGVLLHNMGIVLHNSQKYTQAKEVYEKTIVAKEMATDYSGAEKQADIDETRRALEVTRKHILLA